MGETRCQCRFQGGNIGLRQKVECDTKLPAIVQVRTCGLESGFCFVKIKAFLPVDQVTPHRVQYGIPTGLGPRRSVASAAEDARDRPAVECRRKDASQGSIRGT